MSVLRKILSSKQTREDNTPVQRSQPSRTLSTGSMNAIQHNGAKASAQPRPRSEELENVDYGRPSDFLKGSAHGAEAAQKQIRTTSPERNGNDEGPVGSDAYSDLPAVRTAPQRLTAGALKRQQVQEAIKSQVQSLRKGHTRSRSNGQVMDTSEYSTPWNQVVQQREQQAIQSALVPNQDTREPEALLRQPLPPPDNAPRPDAPTALNHHYETPANSLSRPLKPPRTYLTASQDASSHLSPPQHFVSPTGTIERGTVDQHSTSPGVTGLQPGDYDEPWEKKLKELHLRLPQKQPRQQEPATVIPRDKIPPSAMDQRGRSDRKMQRTPTPEDSVVKRSIMNDQTTSPSTSLSSLGGHFEQSHTFSMDTSSPRSHHSRPLPAPPVPNPRRPSPSPGNVQPLAPLEEQSWFRPKISRAEAEKFLENQPDFSFVVRNSESCRTDYSLSIRDKSPNGGYIHLRIELSDKGYVLGQFSIAFPTVSECIAHYTRHRLTIRGAEHKRLNLGV